MAASPSEISVTPIASRRLNWCATRMVFVVSGGGVASSIRSASSRRSRSAIVNPEILVRSRVGAARPNASQAVSSVRQNWLLNTSPIGIASVCIASPIAAAWRSEEHTSELQSRPHLVCRLLLEKKKKKKKKNVVDKKKKKK